MREPHNIDFSFGASGMCFDGALANLVSLLPFEKEPVVLIATNITFVCTTPEVDTEAKRALKHQEHLKCRGFPSCEPSEPI
jgi:hypothetical protein